MSIRLQDELRQTGPFADLQTEAMVSVKRTAAVLDHAVGEALKPFGLTPTQFNVLRILRGAGARGLCGREVGERLVSQVPDVSRLLDRMEEMGVVSRERDEADRRHVTARITAEGLRLLDEVEPVMVQIKRQRFGQLGDAELRVLIDALGVVRNCG